MSKNLTDAAPRLDDAKLDELARQNTGVGDEFVSGLRAGSQGAMSQLNALAGGVGEALGAGEFARGRYAAAQEDAQEAAKNAPSVSSYRDIHGVRDALKYGAGIGGQIVPAGAAAIGGALLAGPVGAGAVMAPLEAGDIINRQQAAPEGPQGTAGERLLKAGVGGVGSAALQAVVPASVAGKLAGRASGGLLGLGKEAAVGAATGAGSEKLKQNVTGEDNLDAIKEAAVAGGVGGLAMGVPGYLAEGGHAPVQGARKLIGQGVDKAGQLIGQAKDAAAPVQQAAYDLGGRAVDAGKGLVDQGKSLVGRGVAAVKDAMPSTEDLAAPIKERAGDLGDTADRAIDGLSALGRSGAAMVQRIARGESFALPERFQNLDGDALKQAISEDTQAAVKAARDMGTKLYESATSPEVRQRITDALGNLSDRANRAFIASLQVAQDGAKLAQTKVENLSQAFRQSEVAKSVGSMFKKSDDRSGVRKVVEEAISPYLQQHAPELLQGENLPRVGDALRSALGSMMAGKELSLDQRFGLVDALGNHTVNVLDRIRRAMQVSDPKQLESYFSAAQQLREVQTAHENLLDVMRKSLVSGPDSASPQELAQAARGLVEWAGRREPQGDRGAALAAKFHDDRVRQGLQQYFGGDTDKVLLAAEKMIPREENRIEQSRVKVDEDGNPVGVRDGDMPDGVDTPSTRLQVFGKLHLHPDEDPGKAGFEPPGKQALTRAQNTNPNRTVRWASAEEIGMDHQAVKDRHAQLVKEGLNRDLSLEEAQRYADEEIGKYGAPATEVSNDKTSVSADEVEPMKLDTHRFGASPSRIEFGVGGVKALDARRIVREMAGRFDGEPLSAAGEVSNPQRLARLFMEGMAALQDYAGRAIEVPDSVVVSRIDGKDWTWGELKKLDVRAEGDKASDADTQRLVQLRKEFKQAPAQDRREMAREGKKLVGRKEDHLAREQTWMDEPQVTDDSLAASGREDRDPFGPTFDVMQGRGEGAPIHTDGGEARVKGAGAPSLLGGKRQERAPLPEPKPDSQELTRQQQERQAARRAAVDRMAASEDYSHITPEKADSFLKAAKARYDELLAARQKLEDADMELPQDKVRVLNSLMQLFGEDSHADLGSFYGGAKTDAEVRTMLEGTPDPKAVAAKKAAFLEKAASGDKALAQEVRATDDAKGLQRAVTEMAKEKVDGPVFEAAQERMRELVQNPDTAYSLLTKKQTAERAAASGAVDFADAFAHIGKVLGNDVRIELSKQMPHAGEFERVLKQQGGVEDVIRLSVHALNPASAAYHESLHAFFARLADQSNGEIAGILEKAAASPVVTAQLRKLLDHSPEALAQLKDPEERAAYMYQFWAQGQLKLAQEPTTLFGRVKDFILKTLGVWSNDERALHILDYFHRGEFAKTPRGEEVYRALMEPGRNRAIESFKQMAAPLMDLGEKLAVAGHQRLRDTGIPALTELADTMKLGHTSEGKDAGFIPAARSERSRRMNALGTALHGIGQEDLRVALDLLQGRAVANPSSQARQAVATVRNVLRQSLEYMREAGVEVNDLGPDYFPRVWDTGFIASHQKEFLAMLGNYRDKVSDPQKLMNHLMANEGNEFGVRMAPGMQHLKTRVLDFIKPEDAERFLNKNLYETLNSYITQATRRAEWARRFGDESERLGDLLAEARRQGATPEQMETARKYVQAVDGTLGDDVNPEWRRLQGNLMVYQNLRLLPLAIFSSAVDPMGIVVRGGTVRDALGAFKRGIMNVRKGFQADPKIDAAEELAQTLGTIDSTALAHTLGTSYSQGMVGETGRKINDTFFRWNLMERFNTDMRVAATQAALRFLARHADGTASEHSARWISELGLEAGDIQKDAAGDVKLFEHEGLSAEQATRMRLAVNRWVDGAVLRPDAADKPLWMSDPHYALVAHLKQFTFSFQETILKRMAHEAQNGNYGPALALASYVPIMIAADAVKGLIQGGGAQPSWKQDWDAEDYVASGVERAGLLGVGQLALDGPAMLGGPTLQQLGDVVNTLAGREQFSSFALHSMPANALYANWVGSDAAEARVAD